MENEKNDYPVRTFACLLKTELLAVAVFAIFFVCKQWRNRICLRRRRLNEADQPFFFAASIFSAQHFDEVFAWVIARLAKGDFAFPVKDDRCRN